MEQEWFEASPWHLLLLKATHRSYLSPAWTLLQSLRSAPWTGPSPLCFSGSVHVNLRLYL